MRPPDLADDTTVLRVRFYAELNDYLAPDLRFREMVLPVMEAQSVASIIEAQGVPLGEVDLILVNGESVEANHPAAPGDRVSVYPVFESFDIRLLQQLRPEPLRIPRFVLDTHLGKLSRLMRMLGFDARYRRQCPHHELKDISQREGRVLLSRNRSLIASRELLRAYRVRHQHPDDQILEVVGRFQLSGSVRPFTRCVRCNSALEFVPSAEVREQVPLSVRESHQGFWRCSTCERVFWQGSQFQRMRAKLLHLIEKS